MEKSDLEKDIRGDQELYSYFVQRNQFLCEDNFGYLSKHPEIKHMLSDFLSNCLIIKPDDIFKFTKEYFTRYSETPDLSRLVIVVGPHGVGKGSIVRRYMEEMKGKVVFAVSHTTRKPRTNEEEGKDYYFISQDKFLEIKSKDGFIESSSTDDIYYGTSKEELNRINKDGKICILELDIQGAKTIYNAGDFYSHYIGILPPNFEVLRERLRIRGDDDVESINKKLKICKKEISEIKSSNIFNFKIVNDDFNIAYQEFKDIFESIFPELNTKLQNSLTEVNEFLKGFEDSSSKRNATENSDGNDNLLNSNNKNDKNKNTNHMRIEEK